MQRKAPSWFGIELVQFIFIVSTPKECRIWHEERMGKEEKSKEWRPGFVCLQGCMFWPRAYGVWGGRVFDSLVCLFLKKNLLQVSSVGEWLKNFFTFLVSSTICLQWKLGFYVLAQIKALGCPYKSNGESMCSQTWRITLPCLHRAFMVDLHSVLSLHKFKMISFWDAKVGHRSLRFIAQAAHLPPNKMMGQERGWQVAK